MAPEAPPRPSAAALVGAGAIALASAMGIGRFAFTPMLPLMQADGALTLGDGAWLAFANYLGYLVGALVCSLRPPAPQRAARGGLVAVALLTLGMAATAQFAAWWALRFAAGAASAAVLVGVAASVPAALAARGRAAWAGIVFAGVGLGIVGAGLLGLGAGVAAWPPSVGWALLGLVSAAVVPFAWSALGSTGAAGPAAVAAPTPLGPAGWRLVAVYGVFGFGYIVPATFLPAAARAVIPDPLVFGAVWPVFGLAAAASTLVAAFALRAMPPRRQWAIAQAVMALGVLAPAVVTGIAGLVVGALCVGGTFMVATMAGLQEARRLAGPAAPRWIAAMTAAFAAGQLAGPFAVGLLATPHGDGTTRASVFAAALLLAGAVALRAPSRAGAATASPGGTTR